MVYALSKFVSIPSVSNSAAHREDCRQAAIWLRKCLTQLGAEASLVGQTTAPRVVADDRPGIDSYPPEMAPTRWSSRLSMAPKPSATGRGYCSMGMPGLAFLRDVC